MTTENGATNCCANVVRSSDGWRTRYTPCARRGVIGRTGKLYCSQHDPEAKERRWQAKQERWAAENRSREWLAKVAMAEREIVACARRAAKQQASWDDVANAVAEPEKLSGTQSNTSPPEAA